MSDDTLTAEILRRAKRMEKMVDAVIAERGCLPEEVVIRFRAGPEWYSPMQMYAAHRDDPIL
jgi:hypothetical protein